MMMMRKCVSERCQETEQEIGVGGSNEGNKEEEGRKEGEDDRRKGRGR